MPSLPLFPLGTVLFPGGRLPLQIFESRYVELLQRLLPLPEDDRRLGVVAIRRGFEVGPSTGLDLFGVGCEARLDAVAAAPATRPVFHVVLTGTRRFRIEELDTESGTPYLTAHVDWLDGGDRGVRADGAARAAGAAGDEEASTASLAEQARAALTAYLHSVDAEAVAIEETLPHLPYRVVEQMTLDLRDRQSVLEAPDTRARLRAVLALLRRENALVQTFRSVPSLPPPGGAALN